MTDAGYRRLAAAVLLGAVEEACSDSRRADLARQWLASDPWAEHLLDGLGLSPRKARAWVKGLSAVAQPVLFR